MNSVPLVLIDSSSWIEALRKDGKVEVRERVRQLLLSDTAAWCDLVRLELWNGVRKQSERKKMQRLDRLVRCLPIDKQTWDLACRWAQTCRAKGLTIPSTDLVVAACAERHGIALEHSDRHFVLLSEAGLSS